MGSDKSVIGPLIMSVICVAAFVGGAYLIWSQQAAISGSEETTGTIESSSVEEVETQRDTDDDGMPEEVTNYYANVTYTYSHQGREYESTSVFPGAGDPSVSRGEANDIVDRYDNGSQATVHVDTDDPTSAYLVQERNLVFPVAWSLFFGVLALLSGFTTYSRLTSSDT